MKSQSAVHAPVVMTTAGMTESTFILPVGKPALLAFLERLPTARKWKVTVGLYRKQRSDQQNRYLWGVAYKVLQDATGQPAEDWHDYMLGEWSGWARCEMFGKQKIRPIRRSSKLNTSEFSDFVAFIQQRAAEHGLYIPDPNE